MAKEPDLICSCGTAIYQYERRDHELRGHMVMTLRENRQTLEEERHAYDEGRLEP